MAPLPASASCLLQTKGRQQTTLPLHKDSSCLSVVYAMTICSPAVEDSQGLIYLTFACAVHQSTCWQHNFSVFNLSKSTLQHKLYKNQVPALTWQTQSLNEKCLLNTTSLNKDIHCTGNMMVSPKLALQLGSPRDAIQ